MAQNITLTTDQIVLFLKDIETRLPIKAFGYYPLPHYIGGEITVAALNEEARRIMSHVGLTAFTPNCLWSELPAGVGGDIELNGSRSGIINIRLSANHRQNGKAIMAILAHEICHKLLEVNGLYSSMMPDLNEIYTDLATIYCGFSQLILNGYRTMTGNTTHILGYLNFNNYEQAERIVRLLKGASSASVSDGQYPSEIEDDFSSWLKQREKRSLHLDGFKKASDLYADINRDIAILTTLLEQIPEQYRSAIGKLAVDYFTNDPFSGDEVKRPLAAFILANPDVFPDSSNETTRQRALNLKSILETTIKSLKINLDGDISGPILPSYFFCPYCGKKSRNSDGKDKIIRCPSCSKAFYLTGNALVLYDPKQESSTPEPAPRISFWRKIFGKK